MHGTGLKRLAQTLAREGFGALDNAAVTALLEALPDWAVFVGADKRILFANAPARDELRMLDGPPPQCVCHWLIYKSDAPCRECALAEDDASCAVVRRGRRTAWCAAIRDASGTFQGAVVISRLAPRKESRSRFGEEIMEAVDRLGGVLEHAASNIYILGETGRYLMANRALADLFGKSPAEIVGKTPHHFLPQELADRLLANFQRVLHSGERLCEEKNLMVDGRLRTFIMSLFPLRDRFGHIRGVCGLDTEITERKEAELALKKSEEKYRLLAENIFDYVWTMDADLRLSYVSPSVERILGYTPEEMAALPLERRYTPESAAYIRRRFGARLRETAQGFAARDPMRHALRVIRKDGAIIDVELKTSTLISEAGESLGVLGVARDVTDRVQAERELKKSEEKYRSFFEDSAEGIFQFLPDGSLVECNPAMARILGYSSPEELIKSKTDILARIHVQHRDRMEFLRLLARQGRVLDYEAQVFRADGRKVWISTNARAVLNEAGELLCVEGATRDISARKRAEQERMLLVAAVEQTAEAVVIVDDLCRVEYANPAFSGLTGLESTSRGGLQEEAGRFFEEPVRKILARGRKWSGRVRHARADGSEYVAEVLITPIRDDFGLIRNHVMLVRDMTYEIDLEKRLRQSEKLEAIGVLAGGIAHDFNNILTPILLNSEMALSDLPENHFLKKPLTDVVQASERARDLVKQILTFSRQGGRQSAPLSLTPLVRETLKLLGGMVGADVRIVPTIPDKDIVVRADPVQMHQVLMNLCLNASQAMREGGGELDVVLDEVALDEHSGASGPWLVQPRGRYARIVVSDTGHGMDPEVAERIFEPFFTTKRPGQGTGMGLAAVHGIVRTCGGMVSVETEPGKGSAFTVLLPLLDPAKERKSIRNARK